MKAFKIFLLMSLCVCALLGCSGDSSGQKGKTHLIKDSVGRSVELPYPVKRAAIANAYNAELVNAIGALDKIVGVDFNIYNDQTGFHNKFAKEQVIGKSQRELKDFGIKVVVCDAYYTETFPENCKLLGAIFGKEQEAENLVGYFQDKLAYVQRQLHGVPKKRVYFEYRRIGNTTIPGNYFYKMMEYGGADNIFSDAHNVNVDPESIVKRNPEYIVKVSDINVQSTYEPPTLQDQQKILQEIKNRPGWDTVAAVKNNRILLLSHYVHGGASKLVGAMYVAKYLYPERLPDLHPEQIFQEWLEKYQHLPYIPGHTYPTFMLED